MAYKHGNKYIVSVRLPTGKVEKVSFDTEEEADLFKAQRRVDKKLTPGRVIVPTKSDLNFATAALDYFKTQDLELSTRITSARMLNYAITPIVGHVLLKDMSERHFIELVKDMRERGNKNTTVNRHMTLVMAILRWAKKRKLVKDIPEWENLKDDAEVILPPTDEEVRAILENSRGHLKRIVLLGLYTGIRPGPVEMFGLKWTDVDFESRVMYVTSAKKGGPKIRPIPLHSELLQFMREWVQDGHEYIVHYEGRPIQTQFHSSWARALRLAGITRRIRPYDLRHYFITKALNSGADLKATSKIAGHSTPVTTLQTYQHVLYNDMRNAVDCVPSLGVHSVAHTPGNDDSVPQK
jgi:integrase